MRNPVTRPQEDRFFGLLTDDQIDRCMRGEHTLVDPYDPSRLRDTGYSLRFSDELRVFYKGKWRDAQFSKHANRITLKPNMVVLLHSLEEINLPKTMYARLRLHDQCKTGFSSMADVKTQSAFLGKANVKLVNPGAGSVEIRSRDELVELEFYLKPSSPLVRSNSRDTIELILYYTVFDHDMGNLAPNSSGRFVRILELIYKRAIKSWMEGLNIN